MKTLIIGTTLVLAVAGAAAQEIIPYNDYFASTRTRAEVGAEVASAQRVGMWNVQNEITQFPSVAQSTSVDRARVRAEGLKAQSISAPNTVYDMRYQY